MYLDDKSRRLQVRPDFEALAFFRANPGLYGSINDRQTRVLLGAIHELNHHG